MRRIASPTARCTTLYRLHYIRARDQRPVNAPCLLVDLLAVPRNSVWQPESQFVKVCLVRECMVLCGVASL